MLFNRRNKKSWRNIPIDQQILALNKEELEIKREMLKKMELQDQQFSRSMEKLQENISNFTNVLSQSMKMMTPSFNPNPFQYWQVHYQAPYHQQTGSGTQSFVDVGKVNHYQDPYHQYNQSVNSASGSGNNSQHITGNGEKQYTDKTIHTQEFFTLYFMKKVFVFFSKET